MDPDIVFTWRSVKYTVPSSARGANSIVLPNGKVLKVTVWVDASVPPGVLFAREIDHPFRGESVEYIAARFSGVVASHA